MSNDRSFRELEEKLREKYGYETAELLTIYTFQFWGRKNTYSEAMHKAYNKIIKGIESKK